MAAIRYRYQTTEFGHHDIHYRSLRDRQQFDDDYGEAESLGISSASWPLFGMFWQSGEVLAELMTDYNINSRRILEIGCGVGFRLGARLGFFVGVLAVVLPEAAGAVHRPLDPHSPEQHDISGMPLLKHT